MGIDVVTLSLAKNYADSKGGGSTTPTAASSISYTNSTLEGVTNVKEGLDLLANASHSHSNKEILDKLSVSNDKILFDGKQISESEIFYIKGNITINDDESLSFSTETSAKEITEACKNGKVPIIYSSLNGEDNTYYYFICSTAAWESDFYSLGFIMFNGDTFFNLVYDDGNWLCALKNYAFDRDVQDLDKVSRITLEDNIDYRLTNITKLTINCSTYSTGQENWIKVSFADEGDITVVCQPNLNYLGAAPVFKNGETWELSIKENVMAAQKVGDGSGTSTENGVKELFQIPLSVTKTDDDYSITCSVTTEDITNAYSLGKQLICVAGLTWSTDSAYIIPLVYGKKNDVFYFESLLSGQTITISFSAVATENQWNIEIAELKGEKGEKGDKGDSPVKGTDYWTTADKTEIVNDVLAALPTWTGGSY